MVRSFVTITLSLTSLTVCLPAQGAGEGITIPRAIHDAANLSTAAASGPTYIAMALPFAPTHAAKLELDARIEHTLLDRGEAHITLVSPPEFAVLSAYVTHSEMLDIAAEIGVQASEFAVVCVGRGTKREGQIELQTFYLVVKDAALLRFRQAISDI